jgi:hypothetical protein
MSRHPLDGIRPRNALCIHCGYRFGGVPIAGGAITCPECGRSSSFDPPPLGSVARLRRRRTTLRRISWLIIALLTVAILALYWR